MVTSFGLYIGWLRVATSMELTVLFFVVLGIEFAFLVFMFVWWGLSTLPSVRAGPPIGAPGGPVGTAGGAVSTVPLVPTLSRSGKDNKVQYIELNQSESQTL